MNKTDLIKCRGCGRENWKLHVNCAYCFRALDRDLPTWLNAVVWVGTLAALGGLVHLVTGI